MRRDADAASATALICSVAQKEKRKKKEHERVFSFWIRRMRMMMMMSTVPPLTTVATTVDTSTNYYQGCHRRFIVPSTDDAPEKSDWVFLLDVRCRACAVPLEVALPHPVGLVERLHVNPGRYGTTYCILSTKSDGKTRVLFLAE